MDKKNLSRFLSVFSGVKKMPSNQTLRLVSADGKQAEKCFSYGVDFGSTSIKAVQVCIVDRKPQITDLIIEELPPELWNSPGERKKSLPEIFKNAAQKYKIKGEAVSAIPAASVQMKTLELPPMPNDEIGSAIKWAVKQDSSVSPEESLFDYYLLEEENAGSANTIKAMLVTCSKKEVFEQMAIIQGANLLPCAVESDSFASVGALIHSGQIKKEEAILFLEFGCRGCCVNVVINKQIYFKRELAIGGDSLTQSISKRCQVSYSEAELLKLNLGLMSMGGSAGQETTSEQETAVVVNEVLWLHLENLIQEIDYTMKYYSHQLTFGQAGKFDKIILGGGSANLNNFAAYLNSYIGLPVEIADPLRGMALSKEINNKFGDLSRVSARLSVAVGLALRDLE